MRKWIAFLLLALSFLASACKGKPPQWIAFTSERDGNAEIYKMRTDGSQVTRLTIDPAPEIGPSWSPDGNWIAFTYEHHENDEIYKIRADGSQVTRLTDNPADDGVPSWGP